MLNFELRTLQNHKCPTFSTTSTGSPLGKCCNLRVSFSEVWTMITSPPPSVHSFPTWPLKVYVTMIHWDLFPLNDNMQHLLKLPMQCSCHLSDHLVTDVCICKAFNIPFHILHKWNVITVFNEMLIQQLLPLLLFIYHLCSVCFLYYLLHIEVAFTLN